MIMHRVRVVLPLTMFMLVPSLLWAQPQYFATSLHATREGKAFWYSAENGGFEAFTGIPIEDIGCQECHGPTDANGDAYPVPYPGMGCSDCHADDFSVNQTQCYGCHGRQKTEALGLGLSDVHRDAGMVCWDCHSAADLHGDGTQYVSMLEPGAIDADCENCHNPTARPMPAGHAAYDPHGGALHCAACHAETVISCYNCHFESQVLEHVKRAKQPLSDFVMLANREKDGKVYPMSFQSVTYQGDAFVAFGPYTPHTIKREGRSCPECHNNMGEMNEAINQYNDTGKIRFAQWDDVAGILSHVRGVIPIPADYQESLKMDFITYDGDPADPVAPSSNWSSIGKDTWDGHQMLFASPLTARQMESLGFVPANQPPVVDTGGPYSGVVGQPVLFDASLTADPDGDDLVFLWEFGDGTPPPFPSQDPTASHIYDAPGEYTARVAVTDGHHEPVLVSTTVTITDAPPPPDSDAWAMIHPYTFEPSMLKLVPFAGILMVEVTGPSGDCSIAIGMELPGVIFWMDVSGAIYFGNIDRAAGTMSGIVFGGTGGGGIWFAEQQ